MSHTIAAGQTYRALRPYSPLGPGRLLLIKHEEGAASADAINPDTGASCVVLAADLHASASLPTGERRTDGYALEEDGRNARAVLEQVLAADRPEGEPAKEWEARMDRLAVAARALPEIVTVQGLGWERATDLAVLKPQTWLRMVRPDGEVWHMTVVGQLDDGEGVVFLRHGRRIPPSQKMAGLRQADLHLTELWRAVEQPSSGIPGTWCDGLDGAGDHCGKSLLHEGSCRH